MKLQRPRRNQRGMAVIAIMVIISILLIYLMGNARTLNYLGRELKVIEKKQLLRLQPPPVATNSPTVLPLTNAPPRPTTD